LYPKTQTTINHGRLRDFGSSMEGNHDRLGFRSMIDGSADDRWLLIPTFRGRDSRGA
jgi:hypothetical protein